MHKKQIANIDIQISCSTLAATSLARLFLARRGSTKAYTMPSIDVDQGVRTHDNIKQSDSDKNLYRGLELANGMKVLLISDPTTDKAAAALNVQVGYMSDPWELPGLAHFCEHMLFLGTEKYPVENEYHKYLCQHAGSSNAFTASDHTCYHFDVAPENLEPALDRFAAFFVCPLFNEDATDREVNAIHSEHDKNLQNDNWRLKQLEMSTADPKHDFCKFGSGNKATLDVIPKSKGLLVRDELLRFHQQWYSSNIMSLVVLGKALFLGSVPSPVFFSLQLPHHTQPLSHVSLHRPAVSTSPLARAVAHLCNSGAPALSRGTPSVRRRSPRLLSLAPSTSAPWVLLRDLQPVRHPAAAATFHLRWPSPAAAGQAMSGGFNPRACRSSVRQSLDDLARIVVPLFSRVPNRNVERPTWPQHPYGPDQLGLRAHVVPVKDNRFLYMTFPTPDLREHYKAGPGDYVAHLIGHEGPGSLLSELKARGWVNALVGGEKDGARGFSFTIVNVDLTEEGIAHTDDIVRLVFQYLNMLRHEGPQQWIFEELQGLWQMAFNFKGKESPQGYVRDLAGRLHRRVPNSAANVLANFRFEKKGGSVAPHWGVALITCPGVLDAKLHHCFLSFNSITVCARDLLLKTCRSLLRGRLPQPASLALLTRKKPWTQRKALRCANTESTRVWFVQDHVYKLPKAVLHFEFKSPVAYQDPHHTNMTHMFVRLFTDALNEYTYAARQAGLSYSLDNTIYGIVVCGPLRSTSFSSML
ncbi:hypothetical protein HPB48_017558 [Haemaphysalis longicornis]|uniref:Insulin-degrading enzyme n=1 Tax=Haemaphysalis longicornis TaxID=44386 RepID=A0A9J6FJI2_HAELO|nr:hypothetical protein HPB48_017558 [Haemaphysalis longicornis]